MAHWDPQGKTRYYWLDTLPTPAEPTAAQITAGVRLDAAMMRDGAAGFSTDQQTTDATPLAATRQEQVNSMSNVTSGALTLKRGNVAEDDFAELLETLKADVGVSGWVVIVMDGAPATGGLVDVWPSEMGDIQPQPLVGGQMARYVVPFTVNGQPHIQIPIDAGA